MKSAVAAIGVIAAALAVFTVVAWLSGERDEADGEPPGRGVDESTYTVEEIPAVEAPEVVESNDRKPATETETPGEPDPGGSSEWPDGIESKIWEYFAHQPGLKLTNIMSVECDPSACEILFTGTDVNPQHVDEFSGLLEGMYNEPWGVKQGSVGLREISPGIRAYSIRISNVVFSREDPESDRVGQ